jgi:hypothetical protein
VTNTAVLTDSSRLDPAPANDVDSVAVHVQAHDAVELDVTPGAGGLLTHTFTGGLTTTVEIPADATTDTVRLVYTPISVPQRPMGNPVPQPLNPITPSLRLAGTAFDLTAYDCPGCTFLPDFVFGRPITITVRYSDEDVSGLIEEELILAYWTGTTWQDAAATCGFDNPADAYVRDTGENWLSVPVCHLTDFSIQGRLAPIGGYTKGVAFVRFGDLLGLLGALLASFAAMGGIARWCRQRKP